MQSFIGNKKLLALLLAGLSFAQSSTTLIAADEITVSDEITVGNDAAIISSENNTTNASLLDTYPEIFCRKNICNIDTVGDPLATHVKLFNPDLSQIHTFSVKNKDRRGLWTVTVGNKEVPGVQVTRHTKRVFGARIKFDRKFEGYRAFSVGIALEKLLGLTYQYTKTLLIDQYKHYPLWNVILRDREELIEFIEYLSTQNLRSRGTPYFDRKPVMRLTLEADPYLETLEIEDTALLNAFFTMVDARDSKVTAFFNNTITEMDKIMLEFAASSPIQLGETAKEKVFRKIEGFFNDFDPVEMATTAVVWGGGALAFYLVLDKFIRPVGKRWVPTVFEARDAQWRHEHWVFAAPAPANNG